MKLESFGRVLTQGFGDRVIVGIIMGILDSVTPGRVYEYIRDDLRLGFWASDEDWQKLQDMAKNVNINEVTNERVINELRKRRPDLLGVIINHPAGQGWLDKQIAELNDRLVSK